MVWLKPDEPTNAALIDGLRARTLWRVELYRPDGTEPYQVGYTSDFRDVRAAISQNRMTEEGDTVRVTTPRDADDGNIRLLRALGAVLN
jgi:hypothetical protein